MDIARALVDKEGLHVGEFTLWKSWSDKQRDFEIRHQGAEFI